MDNQHSVVVSDPGAVAGGADELRRPLPSTAPSSQPAALSSPPRPSPSRAQWPTPLTSDDGSSGVARVPLLYERASGGSRAVDMITLALSRQHLQLEPPNLLSELPASISASSLATPTPTANLAPQANTSYYESTTPSESSGIRPHPANLRSPTTHPSAPPQDGERDLPNHSSVGTNNSIRPRQKLRPRVSEAINRNEAMQTLVENMICSETQCRVQAPPLSTPVPRGAYGPCQTGNETFLEVDEIMSDDFDLERPVIDSFLEARRAMKPSGISKAEPLRYRSSTETALRCQNLVRNKPRMRKRTKIREKPSSSTTPSAAGPTVACATPTT